MPAVRRVIVEIIATQGVEMDRSGKPNVAGEGRHVLAQLATYDDWAKQAEGDTAEA